MTGRWTSLSIALALTVVGPHAVRAQETLKKVSEASGTDSAAWQSVLEYVVGALSHQLIVSSTDPAAQPWQLTLPDDPEASLLQTQLKAILRARQVMPADTLIHSLVIGPLVITNDTARVDVRFDETRKCPGASNTTGFGWSTTVLVPREPRQKMWGTGSSRTTTAGDRKSC
jgi:hypothetical protein